MQELSQSQIAEEMRKQTALLTELVNRGKPLKVIEVWSKLDDTEKARARSIIAENNSLEGIVTAMAKHAGFDDPTEYYLSQVKEDSRKDFKRTHPRTVSEILGNNKPAPRVAHFMR